MASLFTSYSLPKLYDLLFGGASFTPPTTYQAALFTAAPTNTTAGTEVTGGSYARVSVTNNSTNFPATSGNIKTNGTAINFPTGLPACTVVAWGLFDASGNLWAFGDLPSPQALNAGDTMYIAVGAMSFSF